MKRLFLIALLVFSCCSRAADTSGETCPNQFPNFISDICWSCMFPMKMGGLDLKSIGQEDWDTGTKPVCGCSGSATVGVSTSFWEPAIIVDVRTQPGCLTTLGGLQLPFGGKQTGANWDRTNSGINQNFRQSTYYVSPIMYLLQAVLDDSCSDRSAFDVAWMSEVDPTWNDDELAMIRAPLAFAFGSIPATIAGAADAVAANAGFPISEIFWYAGSWGPIYPMNGTAVRYSDDTFGRLITTRMLAMAHDMSELAGLFAKGGGKSYGKSAMCTELPSAWVPEPIMNKRQYKISRIYPVPQTSKIKGLCCSPIGRSTLLVEPGTGIPTNKYKDFGYMVYRKRDCCTGVIGPKTFGGAL